MPNKTKDLLAKEMMLSSLMGAHDRLHKDPDYKTPAQIIEECENAELK